MSRLIIMTFAALGWCFYIMSGGPDFEPRGLRSAQPERVAVAPEPVPTPVAETRAEDLVAKVSVRSAPAQPQPAPAIEAAVAAEPADLTGFSWISTFADPGAAITLASLEDGATGLQQVAPLAPEADPQAAIPEPERDIREVSGTRVNLRDGPGTIYPVIGKARLGQQVEVLSDSGTGWLRLRVLPAQQVGWISQSLVSKSTN